MPTLAKPSRAAIEAAYDHLKPVVRSAADRFAYRHRRDRDECREMADYFFVEAFTNYDPGKAVGADGLEKRVRWYVWNRLKRWGAKEYARSCRVRPEVPRDVVAPDVEPFDRDGLESKVGEDGKTVLGLVLDTPPELEDAIRARGKDQRVTVRCCLRVFCIRRFGWTGERLRNAFLELEGALS